jgi:hypothetical protein
MAKRVFHPYDRLEEFHAGMWRIVRGVQRQDYIAAAADLLKSPPEFRDAAFRVIDEWPISCEANLITDSLNRIAWLGQAACCITLGSPEESTRVAWHMLAQDEQKEANRVADEAIQTFLKRRRATSSTLDLVDMMS